KVVWRPAHKVRGAEGRSHIVCSCCYLRDACLRAGERNVPERIFTYRSLTDDTEVVRSIITAWASSRSASNALKPRAGPLKTESGRGRNNAFNASYRFRAARPHSSRAQRR